MHCHAIVVGDDPQTLMDSLMQTSGRPPADVWTPLELSNDEGRSGWHTVSDQFRQAEVPSGLAYGQAVHCVWPTSFLREHLGPYALLSDTALSSREVPRHYVQRREGQWWTQLPRFFETIGVHWSPVYKSQWQGHGSADAAEGATMGSLDIEYNLESHDPNLIVGPSGPVFYQAPGTDGHDVLRRRLEAFSLVMDLPSSTPVTLAAWHDIKYDRYSVDWQPVRTGLAETHTCSCFSDEYARRYGHYRGYGDEYW